MIFIVSQVSVSDKMELFKNHKGRNDQKDRNGKLDDNQSLSEHGFFCPAGFLGQRTCQYIYRLEGRQEESGVTASQQPGKKRYPHKSQDWIPISLRIQNQLLVSEVIECREQENDKHSGYY